MVDALLCLTDPGDEVILTDPTYAGMINRVRLVGAVPRLVPLRVVDGEWRLDLDAAAAAGRPDARGVRQQRVLPDRLGRRATPSGRPSPRSAARAISGSLYWGGFEGVLFDGRPVRHPAALPGMRDRTVTVGAPSFEQRMIAWRVGWVVAPGDLVNDVSRVQIYNGLVASGFAQIGTRVALGEPPGGPRRRQRRVAAAPGRDACASSPGCRSSGRPAAWSLLLDVAALGLDPRRGVASPARAEGGRDADGRLGRSDRGPPRALRLQQRAGRASGGARRPRPRRARRTAAGATSAGVAEPRASAAAWTRKSRSA